MEQSARARLMDRVIPVAKSRGNSTYDCVRAFKRVVRIDKVGHAGSLDPQALGLILILTGEATKLSNYLMDLPKRYVADIRLGETTDTQDESGRILRTGSWAHVDRGSVEAVLPRFMGKRFQTPPMYSALKHKGTPLYMLARRGEKIDRNPREVETYEINLLEFQPPVIRIEVYCSRGLYLRVLAEEIGDALNVPAHLGGLVRRRIGHFSLGEAVSDGEFEKLLDDAAPSYTLADAMGHFPAVILSEEQSRGLSRGIIPRLHPAKQAVFPPQGSLLRLERSDGSLGAIAEMGLGGLIQIRRVFREPAA
ncbi:MAG: tRNA pseudouridine(55) synthase TruB [Candidatus Krumholzibacteria bacterium]|nr:tRNA pseudouridine(55) synthase TruB [Candidatus Krumholzibacteria bacterium]